MNRKLHSILKGMEALAGVAILFFYSCKEDDYVYPSILTDYVVAQTDSQGYIDSLKDDHGNRYAYTLQQKGLTPDSAYRCMAKYELTENGVNVYALQQVVSPNPMQYKQLKTDPVETVRIWLSGGYVNLVAGVKGKDKPHKFGFHTEGLIYKNAHYTLNLTLYHDQHNDYPAFTRNAYLSCPLAKYEHRLKKGDSIAFTIHFTGNQKKVYKFGINP